MSSRQDNPRHRPSAAASGLSSSQLLSTQLKHAIIRLFFWPRPSTWVPQPSTASSWWPQDLPPLPLLPCHTCHDQPVGHPLRYFLRVVSNTVICFPTFWSGNLHITAILGSAPPCPILPIGSILSLLYYQPLVRPKQPQLYSATSWFTVREASHQITSNFFHFSVL